MEQPDASIKIRSPKVEIFTIGGDVFLYIDRYLWMWDTEQERTEQLHLAAQAFGNVLVAGYGLGVLQRFLTASPEVNAVHTVEIYPEVVHKAEEHYGEVYGVITFGDFFELPFHSYDRYDCVIGDCWQDITPRCLPDYGRFKSVAQRKVKPDGKILAWGQEFFEHLLAEQHREHANATSG